MPSMESVNLANLERRNLPTIASDLSLLRPQPVLNGLFNFMHKEQAHNLPVSVKYHQVQPITTVSGSAFTQGANYFFDLNVPMNIDILDDAVLEFTLQNTDASSDFVATAPVPRASLFSDVVCLHFTYTYFVHMHISCIYCIHE